MSNIINCSLYEQELLEQLNQKILNLKRLHNITPGLATILVGENPPSVIYVKNKSKRASQLNIKVVNHHLEASITESALIEVINRLNNDPSIHAILLQMPLPPHLDSQKIINHIAPSKDVDGLNSLNAGYLLGKVEKGLIPCTPLGIWYILKRVTTIKGKNAVVVGRSNLVGLPIALILTHENATVTICHSHTQNLSTICKQADILVAAIGKPLFFTKEYIKENATVIDVGINRVPHSPSISTKTSKRPYSVVGDVNTKDALIQNAQVTPVPKGVGKLTIVFLLYNTYKAALLQHNIEDDSYDFFK